MRKRIWGIALLSMLFAPFLQAQEVLTGLSFNPAVNRQFLKTQKQHRFKLKRQVSFLTLPFFDNFAGPDVYPDSTKWVEKEVYVNNGFCYLPPDQGAATFDALDSTGNIYNGALSVPFKADRLTSQPLRLDSVFSPVAKKLTPADSVYLSFYYQPQGTGDAPEKSDSLVLAFRERTGDTVFSHIDSVWVSANKYLKNPQDTLHPGDTLRALPPCDTGFFLVNYNTLVWGDSILFPCDSVFVPETRWKTVWKSPGMDLNDFREKFGKNFVQVMIPVRDAGCFYKGFQFRFFNYASIANSINPSWQSNVDEWNVDDIYLNRGRSAGDTTRRAITFSGTNPIFLKHYTEMPYRQYRSDPTNSLRPDFHVYIANLDRQAHNIHYYYKVQQVNGNFSYGYDGGKCVLLPFYQTGFQDCNTSCGSAQACPPVNSLFSLDYDRDTTSYIIKHYISDSSVQPPLADSMVYRQKFYNEYAYDDGIPEKGYSLEPAGAELAYRFKLKVPDTLTALRIYFNKTKNLPTQFFDLLVWRDNNGKPGEVIYRQKNMKVQWQSGLYPFVTYKLDTGLLISGTVYIGYQQQDQSLNVGFDANNDAGNNIFYYTENAWYKTAFKGALLMRPVFGKAYLKTGILQHLSAKQIQIYPNPAGNILHFALPDKRTGEQFNIRVYNLYGQLVLQTVSPGTLHLSTLVNGMYFLQIRTGQQTFTSKFIVKH